MQVSTGLIDVYGIFTYLLFFISIAASGAFYYIKQNLEEKSRLKTNNCRKRELFFSIFITWLDFNYYLTAPHFLFHVTKNKLEPNKENYDNWLKELENLNSFHRCEK